MRNVGNSNGARARVRGVGEIEKKTKQNKKKTFFLVFVLLDF
jgi:hypothetical protein